MKIIYILYIFRYSAWIWVLTFITYCSYHMSRKPISVVKSVLNQNCSDMIPPDNTTNNTHWCDWAPFGKKEELVENVS